MKTWVKLYTEINRDPAVVTLTLAQRGIWMALLALAGEVDEQDEDGSPTGRLDTLVYTAVRIHVSVADLSDAIPALEERGMVRELDGVLYLPAFAERQSAAPSQRRPAQRDRQRACRAAPSVTSPSQPCPTPVTPQPDGCHNPVTTPSQPCHEPVTTLSRAVTRTESESESESETDPGAAAELLPLTSDVGEAAAAAAAAAGGSLAAAGVSSGGGRTVCQDPDVRFLFQLIERAGILVCSGFQDEQWCGLLEVTRDQPLLEAAFREVAATSPRQPSPKLVRAILERCVAEGCQPGEWRGGRAGRAGGSARSRAPLYVSTEDTRHATQVAIDEMKARMTPEERAELEAEYARIDAVSAAELRGGK